MLFTNLGFWNGERGSLLRRRSPDLAVLFQAQASHLCLAVAIFFHAKLPRLSKAQRKKGKPHSLLIIVLTQSFQS